MGCLAAAGGEVWGGSGTVVGGRAPASSIGRGAAVWVRRPGGICRWVAGLAVRGFLARRPRPGPCVAGAAGADGEMTRHAAADPHARTHLLLEAAPPARAGRALRLTRSESPRLMPH